MIWNLLLIIIGIAGLIMLAACVVGMIQAINRRLWKRREVRHHDHVASRRWSL